MIQAMYAAEKSKFISITRQIGNWTEQVLGGKFQQYLADQAWVPSVNLCEHEDYYCLIVELAGVRPDEISLSVQAEGRALVLSGQRQAPMISQKDDLVGLHLMEIDHGRFNRVVELPDDVDPEGIDAKYRQGYLWVKMPKK